MTTNGLFISFEGIDGAGKSTHIEGLAKAFRGQGRGLVVTREPGGTPLAEKIRVLVLNDTMDVLTEALLVFAARYDHLQQVIEPALAKGMVVLCDRFTDASFAYQGGGHGLDEATLSALEQRVQTVAGKPNNFIRQPDLTIWFDLPPEVAAQRLSDARMPDKFEAKPLEFFQRVAAAYQRRVAASPARFARIDASQSRDAVWQQVLQVLHGKAYLS